MTFPAATAAASVALFALSALLPAFLPALALLADAAAVVPASPPGAAPFDAAGLFAGPLLAGVAFPGVPLATAPRAAPLATAPLDTVVPAGPAVPLAARAVALAASAPAVTGAKFRNRMYCCPSVHTFVVHQYRTSYA